MRARSFRGAKGYIRRGITTAGMIAGMTTLLAFVAVAVDIAILNSYETESRSAAGAAALAGAAELWDRSLLPAHLQDLGLPAAESSYQTVLERQMLHSENQIRQVAEVNTVGGKAVVLSEEDLVFTTFDSQPSLTVQCAFTNQRGNPISGLVGQALGVSDADLQVESQAVLDQRVAGFIASSTTNAPVVPIVIDADAWSVQVMASSIVTIQISVDGCGLTSNATLCLMQPPSADVIIDHQVTTLSVLTDQIRAGIRRTDLSNLPDSVIALSTDPGQPLDLAAASVSAHSLEDIGDALRSIAGRPRAWMVGSEYTDTEGVVSGRVTSFVAAKVLACSVESCSVDGGRLTVILEPCLFSTSAALVRSDQVRNPWLAKVCLVR